MPQLQKRGIFIKILITLGKGGRQILSSSKLLLRVGRSLSKIMNNKLLLIDYENIQNLDGIKNVVNYNVKVFVGFNQNKIPLELIQQTQRFGDSLEWIKVNGQGKNALDFFIAFYLGTYIEKNFYTEYVVVSKDSGYDPMINHINQAYGAKVKRITNIIQSSQYQVKETEAPDMVKLIDHLKKIPGNKRPKKRKTLSGFAISAFSNKKKIEEVDEIIEQLYVNKKLSESNGLIKYSL